MRKKQVNKEHYTFSKYLIKPRWAVIWHQLDEVLKLKPNSVLEIGPGPGVFKSLASIFNISVETLDIDPELNPDYVAAADAMPFKDKDYDLVCAFQMLEHIPYEESLRVFKEMSRVAGKYIVISLPDAKKYLRCSFHIPKIGNKFLHIPVPRIGLPKHKFVGEHYWVINEKNHPLNSVVIDLVSAGNVNLLKTFKVDENPYHRFLIFSKK